MSFMSSLESQISAKQHQVKTSYTKRFEFYWTNSCVELYWIITTATIAILSKVHRILALLNLCILALSRHRQGGEGTKSL